MRRATAFVQQSGAPPCFARVPGLGNAALRVLCSQGERSPRRESSNFRANVAAAHRRAWPRRASQTPSRSSAAFSSVSLSPSPRTRRAMGIILRSTDLAFEADSPRRTNAAPQASAPRPRLLRRPVSFIISPPVLGEFI